MRTPTFGIDLGTTCSLIGYVEGGRPRLIPIDGDVLMPSVVTFPEEGAPVVGSAALNQLLLEPDRTLRSTKRWMGTDHRWNVGAREVTPPEVATEILRALVRGAEKETGMRPERVVVTVPAWFPHDARADTQRAAEAAGLEVVRLINEPTAAALAHAHGEPRDRMALVYDLGGGTFDASLVHQQGDLIEVLASSGDTHLGGDDLDTRVLARLLEDLDRDDADLANAVRANRGAHERFLSAVREAKHELSEGLKATLRAPFLADVGGEARHLELPMDRELIDEELLPLLERTFECVDSVLKDASVAASEIDELLLVGGSTRAPLVREALARRFGLEGTSAVPPQEAVGLGAAIQAALVDGDAVSGVLLDVTPYALSIAALEPDRRHFSCSVIVPRNTTLPGRHSRRFGTLHPEQKNLSIPVLQGSHPNPLRNVALGTIDIDDLPPAPLGQVSRPIGVEFRQDPSGLVSIRVTDELSGRSVDGEVVVGGQESAKAREELLESIERDELVPGDGTDDDPFLEREPDRSGVGLLEPWDPTASQGAAGADDASGSPADDLAEARAAFELVLTRQKELAAEHPEHALALRQLATSGQEALAAGDSENALRKFDELSDSMFEQGIYL